MLLTDTYWEISTAKYAVNVAYCYNTGVTGVHWCMGNGFVVAGNDSCKLKYMKQISVAATWLRQLLSDPTYFCFKNYVHIYLLWSCKQIQISMIRLHIYFEDSSLWSNFKDS